MKKKLSIYVLIMLVLMVSVYFLGSSVATTESTALRNQIVNGLTFENAELDYKNGISTLTVSVVNNNEYDYYLKSISVNVIIDEEILELNGYIGSKLSANSSNILTVSVNKNITNMNNINYVINK